MLEKSGSTTKNKSIENNSSYINKNELALPDYLNWVRRCDVFGALVMLKYTVDRKFFRLRRRKLENNSTQH